MAFLESLFGSPGQIEQVSRFTPQQQALQDQMLSALGPLLQQLQQPTDISDIMAQRQRAFQEETVPGLAERFTAMGGAGGQRSSAFQGALGRAGGALQQDLAALQQQGQQQELGRLQGLFGGLSQGAFQPSFETAFRPGTTGFLGGLAPAAGQALGLGLTGGFGGGNPLMALLSLLGGRQQQQAQIGLGG